MTVPLNPALPWIPGDKRQGISLSDPDTRLRSSYISELLFMPWEVFHSPKSCVGAHSWEMEPQATLEHRLSIYLSPRVFSSFAGSSWGSGWGRPQWIGWHWIHLRDRLCSGFLYSDLYPQGCIEAVPSSWQQWPVGSGCSLALKPRQEVTLEDDQLVRMWESPALKGRSPLFMVSSLLQN